MQDPDIAGIADEIEAALVELDALLDGRHQPAEPLAMLARRGDHLGDGLGEFGVVEFAGNAERDAEIEMADPQAVDARDGGDGVGILDPVGGLDLGEEGGALVGGGELVLDRAGPVAVMGDLEGHAAAAFGRVLDGVEDRLGFLGRTDHRQHDALGAHVAGPRDVMVLPGGAAHDGRQLGRLHVAQHALHRLEAEAAVLHVEQHEIAPGRLHDMADAGRGELDDEMAEFRAAAGGKLLQALL